MKVQLMIKLWPTKLLHSFEKNQWSSEGMNCVEAENTCDEAGLCGNRTQGRLLMSIMSVSQLIWTDEAEFELYRHCLVNTSR